MRTELPFAVSAAWADPSVRYAQRADPPTHCRNMAQCVCIVVILPALCRQQHHGSQQGWKVVDDIGRAAIVIHTRRYPRDDIRYLNAFEPGATARTGIGAWMRYYNEMRPHSSHGLLTPAEFYAIQKPDLKLAA